MPEIDNCPVCNTTCELEYGLEEAVGSEYERAVLYATCKTCKTRWRRRDDPEDVGRLIYERWACRILQQNEALVTGASKDFERPYANSLIPQDKKPSQFFIRSFSSRGSLLI